MRIIVIGLPSSPFFDQLFWIEPSTLEVLPNLIELPNLPSSILSPAKGKTGWILPSSTNVPPLAPFKLITLDSSLTFLALPATISC